MTVAEMGRKGGSSRSARKLKSAKKNLREYWKKVNSGELPRPKVGRKKNGATTQAKG